MNARLLVVLALFPIAACGGGGTTSATTSDGASSTGSTGDASTTTTTTTSGTTSEPTGGSGSVTDGGTTSSTTNNVDTTTDDLTTSTTTTSTTDASSSTSSTTDSSTSDGSTSDSTTGSSTTDASSTGDSSTTDTSTSTTGEPVVEGLWLVSIEDTSSPTRLYKIDLETGAGTHLCSLDTSNDYNTTTFSRDGLLFGANASTGNLEIINPCDCKRTIVGPTKATALPGITADQALGLYGLETSLDNFVRLDTMTGNASIIGPLGLNWGTGGLTWSDAIGDTYAINGSDDRLYRIDHVTGKATLLIQTNYNFGSVGIEWHPKTQEIYACSNPAELLKVSEKTGEVTVVGPMNLQNQAAHCDNLAAPWVPIACVEDK